MMPQALKDMIVNMPLFKMVVFYTCLIPSAEWLV